MALRRSRRHDPFAELFPGFTDVAEIGVGSLAVVFRAREPGTRRPVALKLLNVRDASPRAIESFERESVALGALGAHPNIVTLYRTFRTVDGRPVLVLELCSGAVADRLHDGTGLPVPEVVGIGIKVADALQTAHAGGVLHRDVKPQNILITSFGEPALADFGVAMLQSSTQTTTGLFDFTTLHAAPELLEGGGASAATDVYELASSLYQLIAGRAAFRAFDGESPASVILRILRDPVRPLSAAQVPPALSDLLVRAMAKQMRERPPTAAEFAAELARIEADAGWSRTSTAYDPLPAPMHLSVPAPPLPPPPAPVRPTPPPPPPPPEPDPAYVARHAPAPSPPAPPVATPPPPTAPLPPPTPEPVATDGRIEFHSDRSFDPALLERTRAVRSGTSAVTVTEAGLRVRDGVWRRHRIAWADLIGFEVRPDPARRREPWGHLVAVTRTGPVDLRGTRRAVRDLRPLHALFDAQLARARVVHSR